MKAIICGAGIAGLTLAWWLERDGWRVLLVERAHGPRTDGYMIDFLGSGYDVAELMGLLPHLRRIQTTNRVLQYVDRAGRGRGRLDYAGLAALVGGRAFTFMRGDFEQILYEALGGRVPVRYGRTIRAIDEYAHGIAVTLSDGTVERADLVIGADGIHSQIRGLVLGPEERFLRYLGYHTASYLFTDDELRARVGDRFLIVAQPGRQVGIYPTNDGRLAAWLVHRTPEVAVPIDPSDTVRAAYRDLGDLGRRTLEHCPPLGDGLYYDQVAQIELPCWSAGRVTLVGDACQAVSLMAGQGASMAVGGAYALARELRAGGSITDATARYERRMRPHVLDKQRAGRRTAEWLVPSSRWRIAARAAALSALRLPGVPALVRPAVKSMVSSVVSAADRPSARDRAPARDRRPGR